MPRSLKRALLSAGIVAGVVAGLAAWYYRPRAPELAVREFEAQFRAGEVPPPGAWRYVPLLLGARGTPAAIAERVRDPGMPGRVDAVSYLGQVRAEPAVPVLTAICESAGEPVGLRVQALYSLALIAPHDAVAVAERVAEAPEPLRSVAEEVKAGRVTTRKPLTRWDVILLRL